MELEKVKNHKHRADIFGLEIIAQWPDIDSEEIELIKQILKNEIDVVSLA